MNRARKHELERNVLAERIESAAISVQPILPAVLGVLAIVAVGAIMWGVYSSSVKRRQSAAWTDYYFNLSGSDAEAYLDVAEAYPQSEMAGWARLAAGDNYLHQGIEALFRNRSEGEQNLQQAITTYEKVLEAADSSELRSKALWGLAQAHESLGQLDEAADYYEQFTSATTQPQLMSAAGERLAFINSPTGKNFYDWFSELDPKPDAPIELPSGLNLPPMTPDLQFGPTDGGLSLPGSPSSTQTDPSQTDTSSPDTSLPEPTPTNPPAAGQEPNDPSAPLPGESSTENSSLNSTDLPELELAPPTSPSGDNTDIQSLELPLQQDRPTQQAPSNNSTSDDS